jgi:peptide deformylase
MILALVPKNDLILRRKAVPVANVNDNIRKLLRDMQETMAAWSGVGLAAPQVGIPLRAFVISVNGVQYSGVNPEIVKSKGESIGAEGCLSIMGLGVQVKRNESIVVKYRNAQGAKKRLHVDGLLARVFQHEIDHLQGTMIIDKEEQVAEGENSDEKKVSSKIIIPTGQGGS